MGVKWRLLLTLQLIESETTSESDSASLILAPGSTQVTPRSSSGTPGLCRGQCPPCADPPTYPPPTHPHHYVYLALMLKEAGAGVGDGRAGQGNRHQGHCFLATSHSGSFSLSHLSGHSAPVMAQESNKCASSLHFGLRHSDEK